MIDQLEKLLTTHRITSHRNQGILVINKDKEAGVDLAKKILYDTVDTRSAVYLSGGSTPQALYTQFASEEVLSPGAVAMVDERYGVKWHETSNERMMRDTGVLRYFQMRDIPFYPVLTQNEGDSNVVARRYDKTLRDLQPVFMRHIAVLGIGRDGHIAGIAPNRHDFSNLMYEEGERYQYVSSFIDERGPFKERVTMTFLALPMMDLLLLLVFGDDKKKALDLVFSGGTVEEIPGRFLTQPEISQKTVLITDQNV